MKPEYTIYSGEPHLRPAGQGRDDKEYTWDMLSGYHIVESGLFWIDYGSNFDGPTFTSDTTPYDNDPYAPNPRTDGWDTLVQKIGSNVHMDDITPLITNYVWHLFVTDYVESHKEGHFVYNSFSDTNVGFSTGALPIQVTISGFLPLNPQYNSKLDFMSMYRLFLRGSQTKVYNVYTNKFYKIPMVFQLKKTFLKLNLTNLTLNTSVEMPDFEHVTISGIGYNYANIV